MSAGDIDERVFRSSEGYVIASVLQEIDGYSEAASQHGFSALLGKNLVSADEVKARFRRPSGHPLIQWGAHVRSEVLRRLLELETTFSDLFSRSLPDDVFVMDERGRFVLHAPLIGWHRAPSRTLEEAYLSWWRVFADGGPLPSERGTGAVRNFRELASALGIAGCPVAEGLAMDLESRVALVRRRAIERARIDPMGAAEELIRVLEDAPGREMVLLAMEISASADAVELFDRALSTGAKHGVCVPESESASLDAWRAWKAHDSTAAVSLAVKAIEHGVGLERAREVLVSIYEVAGQVDRAIDQWTALLAEYPSEQRLRRAVEFALRARRTDCIRRILAAYPHEVRDAMALLASAQGELQDGDARACLATLAGAAAACLPMNEAVARELLRLAVRALATSAPLERASRVLSLVTSLQARLPNSVALRLTRARWLLAGNFNQECRVVLEKLPMSADREHLAALCAFRAAEYDEAVWRGMHALKGGVEDPDLVTTVASACGIARQPQAFIAFRSLPVVARVAAAYPSVLKELLSIERELHGND